MLPFLGFSGAKTKEYFFYLWINGENANHLNDSLNILILNNKVLT
jgi:hypothetical protein